MSDDAFKTDLSESFEHLPNAPIVEAVIHWRARAEKKLEPDALLENLKEKLPDYPNVQRQRELGVFAEIGPDGASVQKQDNWLGYRFESADKLNVAQFTRNGFVFSRLKPYEEWEAFESEAKRLWRVYCEMAEPSEVQRLDVRFINLVTPIQAEEVSDLLTVPPCSPKDLALPLKSFMHQSTFEIPGHPYNLNVIQTIQPPRPPERESFGLILDLDVFTTRPIQFDEMDDRLRHMRSIKNKAFFSFVTEAAIARFRE